jgi:hypothetical protein
MMSYWIITVVVIVLVVRYPFSFIYQRRRDYLFQRIAAKYNLSSTISREEYSFAAKAPQDQWFSLRSIEGTVNGKVIKIQDGVQRVLPGIVYSFRGRLGYYFLILRYFAPTYGFKFKDFEIGAQTHMTTNGIGENIGQQNFLRIFLPSPDAIEVELNSL